MGEIQPWDEALYCVRANACLQFSVWLDQTQYAVGGLYSSTHPPLGIWGITIGKFIFGDTTFAPRLFIAFTSVISLLYLYKLAKYLTNERTALISTVIFGNAQIWLWYGHHAQLDIPMHAALVVTLYYTVQTLRGNNKSVLLAGIFFGIALLTKTFQPLYILPFLCSLAYIFRGEQGFKKVVKIVLIAICIASPWYVFMALRHPAFFGDWTGLFSSLASGTYRGMVGSWWYYLNQVVVNYPLIVLLQIGVFLLIHHLRDGKKLGKNDQLFMASIIFLVGMIALVSFVRTNMPHFILFLSIPTTLCTIFCVNAVLQNKLKSGVIGIILLTIIAVLWSGSEQLRMFVKGSRTFPFVYDLNGLMIVGVGFALSLLYTVKKYVGTSRVIIALATLIVLGNMYRWTTKQENIFSDGAEIVANILKTSSASNILLIHSYVPHEELLPQFAYYSGGLNLQWDRRKTVKSITFNTCSVDNIRDFASLYDAVGVYKGWNKYFTPDTSIIQLLNNVDSTLLSSGYRKTITRQYLLYLR
ncbi:MAG TPA: glycosyltransferase family 39 protein [Candidatus Kapabacteria bacterium]